MGKIIQKWFKNRWAGWGFVRWTSVRLLTKHHCSTLWSCSTQATHEFVCWQLAYFTYVTFFKNLQVQPTVSRVSNFPIGNYSLETPLVQLSRRQPPQPEPGSNSLPAWTQAQVPVTGSTVSPFPTWLKLRDINAMSPAAGCKARSPCCKHLRHARPCSPRFPWLNYYT